MAWNVNLICSNKKADVNFDITKFLAIPRKCCVFPCKTNYRNQHDKTMCGEKFRISV